MTPAKYWSVLVKFPLPSHPFYFCLPSKSFHKLLASKLIAWSLCQSVMGERDIGIPSCWSGFCNLWASFLGMRSELFRFLKGKPSTDLGGLGWDLCGLNQEFESEPEKHPLGCSDLGWDSCSPTELTEPLSLGEEAWGLCVPGRRVRLQCALACWTEPDVPTSQQM